MIVLKILSVGALSLAMTTGQACAQPDRVGDVEPAADQAVAPAMPAAVPIEAAPPIAATPMAVAAPPQPTQAPTPPGPTAQRKPTDGGDVPFRTPAPRPSIAPDAIIAELERIRDENTRPTASGWQQDAAATVADDAKLAGRIAKLLREPTSTYFVRSIGIALLREDGTKHGQAAIVELLSDPAVQADMMFSSLVLEVYGMPRPSEAIVTLVQSLRESKEPQVRSAATTVLGTQIWALSVSERVALADTLAARLQADLQASNDPTVQANLIEALAHGARPQTRALVRRFARANDPILRTAAAKGLASDESSAVIPVLLTLLVDKDTDVQSAALDTLHWRTLNAAQKRTVHAAIVKGKLHPNNLVLLAMFVDRHFVGTLRTRALEAIAARAKEDEPVQDKVRELLAGAHAG